MCFWFWVEKRVRGYDAGDDDDVVDLCSIVKGQLSYLTLIAHFSVFVLFFVETFAFVRYLLVNSSKGSVSQRDG